MRFKLLFSKTLSLITGLYTFYKHNELKKLKKVDVLFTCKDSNLSYLYHGKYYSPLIHSVAEQLGQFDFNTALIISSVSKYRAQDIFGASYVINRLLENSNYLYKYSRVIYGDRARSPHNSIVSQIEVWLKILERTKPKFIIGIQPPMELCIASDIMNIKVADLQHGILSHEGYYGQFYRESCNQLGWPTYILCWNSASENWANTFISKYAQPLLFGNPWINRFLLFDKSDDLINEEAKKSFFKKRSNNILVSLQYEESENNLNSIGIPKILLDFITTKGDNYHWLFRIHPVLLNKMGWENINNEFNTLFLGRDNIEWKNASIRVLPIVLLNCSLHITWNSATTVDASFFGIKTAVLSSDNNDFFSLMVEEGLVDFVGNDVNEIELWLSKNTSLNSSLAYRKIITDYKTFFKTIF